MNRPACLVPLALLLAGRAAAADPSNDPPCKAEMQAVVSLNPGDPSLAPPSDADAAAHVKKANNWHRMSEYAKAIAEYTDAGAIEDATVILFDLAQVFREQKDYDKAIREYQLFLDRAQPGPEVVALVQCHMHEMRNEMDHAASTAPPTGPAPDGTEGNGGSVAVQVSSSVAKPWYADPIGWSAAGSGALATTIGAVLLLDASDLDTQADRTALDSERESLRAQAHTRRIWGGVVGGVGVVALAAGVIKLILVPKPEHAPHTNRVASWTIGPGTIGLAGTF